MAQKLVAGTGGSVSLPTGFYGKFTSWSATETIYNEETTGFTSGGFDEFEPTGVGMSGSATAIGYYDAASSVPFPKALADGSSLSLTDLKTNSQGTATFTATTGCSYTGTIQMDSISMTRAAKGKLELTFNWKFTGAYTVAWDETT